MWSSSPAVLLRRPHVDQRAAAVGRARMTSSRNARIGPSSRFTIGYSVVPALGHVGREGAALGDPLLAAAVHQPHVGVPEQREDPQRVGGPPVEVVAVEHHGVSRTMPFADMSAANALGVEVVSGQRIVEVHVPVDLDRRPGCGPCRTGGRPRPTRPPRRRGRRGARRPSRSTRASAGCAYCWNRASESRGADMSPPFERTAFTFSGRGGRPERPGRPGNNVTGHRRRGAPRPECEDRSRAEWGKPSLSAPR